MKQAGLEFSAPLVLNAIKWHNLCFEYYKTVLNHHQELGRNGEQAAKLFLEGKGHILLECNYRFEHKEIDIISLCDDILVFTEIKTRSHYRQGYPEEAVHMQKQQLLKQAAEYYCFLYPQYEKLRFDVISILMKGGRVKELLHFEDAFY